MSAIRFFHLQMSIYIEWFIKALNVEEFFLINFLNFRLFGDEHFAISVSFF